MSDANDKIYARVVDDEVAEYPVLPLHITNRGHPLDWYVEVTFDKKPDVPEFHWLQETLTVSRSLSTGQLRVRASYTVVPETLAALLNTLRLPGETPGTLSDTPMSIADVPPAKVQRIAHLATYYADEKLHAWVQTRNYDSITSAASYRGSSVGNFNAEGTRAFEVRDQTWQALYDYLGKVMTAQLPVPIRLEDIDAILPPMTWAS